MNKTCSDHKGFSLQGSLTSKQITKTECTSAKFEVYTKCYRIGRKASEKSGQVLLR